jgi:hypothetical protein
MASRLDREKRSVVRLCKGVLYARFRGFQQKVSVTRVSIESESTCLCFSGKDRRFTGPAAPPAATAGLNGSPL